MKRLLLLALLSACARGTSPTQATDTPDADPADAATPDTTTTASEGSLHGTQPPKALPAPDFTAHHADGTVRHKDHLLGHPTVLWFFPMTGTPG